MSRRQRFGGEWETIPLGELEKRGDIGLYRGNVISQKDIDRIPGEYPIYSSSVHTDGLFGSYGEYMFDEELITWSVDGGGHFFYRPKHRFSVTNVCGYLRIRTSSIDYRYLAYHLQSLHSRTTFDYTLKAHPSVIRGFYTVALPQLREQRAIAAVLGDVDGLIGSLEALIAKKRAVKQAAMQQLLTARTRLPGFGGEWETRRLGKLAKMASGGTPLTSVGAYYDGGIPWVSINDMTSSAGRVITKTERTLSRLGLENSAARLFPVGTVLYAMYASIGECCIAGRPLCTSQAILGIQPNGSLRPAFLYYSLTWMKRRVKTLGQQGTQANLNKEMVQELLLPLPPLPEQQAIASVLSDMDVEIETLERRLDKTRSVKQGMMQQLLTGAVRLPIPDGLEG